MAQKIGPYGGNKGTAFDDGIYEGIKKVILGEDDHGVVYIKIEYEKDGKFETREHGKNTGTLKEFAVDYPDEYITTIEGTYSDVTKYNSDVIKTLVFKTSHGRTSPMFGKTAFFKTAFVVETKNGGKLLGFHGRSGDAIDSIGAYFFTPSSSSSSLKQFEPNGGNGGSAWDDGIYDGLKKLIVGLDVDRVSFVKFEYVKKGSSISHSHGKKQQEPKEFVIDYPNEHVTSLEGTHNGGIVTSLTFKTSKNRVSPVFGKVVGTKFVLEEKGFMLVGFRGRSGDLIDAIGAHFAPALVPAKKLEGKGGEGGIEWDDGVYENVKKIYVGQGDSGVAFVKFEYQNGTSLVSGDGHGKKTLLGTEEFELDYPDEYIVSVEGNYEKVFGIETDVVTMLKFKTNKRTSQPFGIDSGEAFVLEGKDYKIVGFHGKAGDFVHKIGVHISPINKS